MLLQFASCFATDSVVCYSNLFFGFFLTHL